MMRVVDSIICNTMVLSAEVDGMSKTLYSFGSDVGVADFKDVFMRNCSIVSYIVLFFISSKFCYSTSPNL